MSYSFYAPSPAPNLDVLTTWPGGLLCEEIDVDGFSGPMQDGQILHVYQPGVTTRSVELAYERGAFQARVLTLACHEDYQLALHLTCEVARRAGSQVESEEGVQFAPEAVDAHYGPAWVDDHVCNLVRSTVAMVQQHGTLMMSGANCTVTLDRPTLDRVLAGATEPHVQAERLFQLFRDVSFPDDAWFKASVMAVTLKDASQSQVTLVVWGPGVQYQLPKADLLALVTDQQILVPWDQLADLAGDRLTWVDGATARLLPFPERDWPALVERAQGRHTSFEDFAAARAAGASTGLTSEEEVASDRSFLVGVALTVLVAAVIAYFVIQGM